MSQAFPPQVACAEQRAVADFSWFVRVTHAVHRGGNVCAAWKNLYVPIYFLRKMLEAALPRWAMKK
jgi:hypothetical protein